MLGRIRVIEENQKVSLFIHARTSNYFQHLRDFKIQNNLDCIEFLEKYSNISHILEDEFIPGNTFQYKYKNYKNFIKYALYKTAVTLNRYRRCFIPIISSRGLILLSRRFSQKFINSVDVFTNFALAHAFKPSSGIYIQISQYSHIYKILIVLVKTTYSMV